jgi:hypothetical protein
MRYGPNEIYTCPQCGNLIQNKSLMSGNTFDAELYSDGKRIAPMLPEFPNLTDCKKCRNIFWLSKTKKIGEYSWGDEPNQLWENADYAEFLSVHNYFKAIKANIAENRHEELYIRKRIWWSFNDRLRKGGKLFRFVNEEVRWKENIDRLLELLDIEQIDQKIMVAELHRNLGEFERCLELINSIEDVELEWLKDGFKRECNNKNRNVFLFATAQ